MLAVASVAGCGVAAEPRDAAQDGSDVRLPDASTEELSPDEKLDAVATKMGFGGDRATVLGSGIEGDGVWQLRLQQSGECLAGFVAHRAYRAAGSKLCDLEPALTVTTMEGSKGAATMAFGVADASTSNVVVVLRDGRSVSSEIVNMPGHTDKVAWLSAVFEDGVSVESAHACDSNGRVIASYSVDASAGPQRGRTSCSSG